METTMTGTIHHPQSKRSSSRVRTTIGLTGAILAGLTAAVLMVASAAAAPGHTHAKTSLQEDANALVAAGAPGAILYVRDGDQTTSITAGYGDLAEKTPMRANDHFKIASLTKTYTATLVLQLMQEGKLRIGDNVEQWLPKLVPNG